MTCFPKQISYFWRIKATRFSSWEVPSVCVLAGWLTGKPCLNYGEQQRPLGGGGEGCLTELLEPQMTHRANPNLEVTLQRTHTDTHARMHTHRRTGSDSVLADLQTFWDCFRGSESSNIAPLVQEWLNWFISVRVQRENRCLLPSFSEINTPFDSIFCSQNVCGPVDL